MALANKYRPSTWDDVSEQSVVTGILKSICDQPDLPNRNFLLIGPAGCGKAQPLSSKVLTVNGFVNMGDISIGTKVFTGCGNIGQVSGIYPQGTRPIYEITLQDGTAIRVSDEHLNVVYRYNTDKKEREDFTLTTLELINLFKESRFKLRIDIPSVDWPERQLPVDPYLVGTFIGQGSFNNDCFQFSSSDNDVINKVNSILVRDWGLSLQKCGGYYNVDYDIVDLSPNQSKIGEFADVVNSMGLFCSLSDKRIPEIYLMSSYEQRLELLRGLYDVDGYTDIMGKCVYTACSAKLSEDFAFLVRSLGVRDKVCQYRAKYRSHGQYKYIGFFAYDHVLKFPNSITYCSSSKQLSRRMMNQNEFMPLRNIVSIEYVGDEDCQCIMVDHPDHTYISDGFIPTHNTTIARIMANALNNGCGEPIEIDAASNNGVDSVRELVQQARSYPIGCEYKVFIADEVHAFSSAAWQVLLKTLEESPAKSVWIMCTTNPEKIPATILSRVQTFQLSKISLKGIHDRLIHVIDKENSEGASITYTDDAINYIAKLANGGMRDSLTLLDKALAYGKDITSESLTASLGLPNYDRYFDLLSGYAKHDNKQIAEIINEVYNSGVNFVKWFEGFHSFTVNIIKYILLQDINKTMIPSHYLDKISKYSDAHLVVCLRLANKLLKLNQELKSTQYLQEVALTHLCKLPQKKG